MAANQRISMIGPPGAQPVTAGVYAANLDEFATNDRWPHPVFAFTDTGTDLKLVGTCDIPGNYSSTPVLKVKWSSSVTTGNVVWDFSYRTINLESEGTESLDQTTQDETVSVTDAAPGTTLHELEASVALTAGNFGKRRTVQWELVRKGTSGSDTMAGTAFTRGPVLDYTSD